MLIFYFSPELPVKFTKPLVDISGTENGSATFECEISKARWKKSGSEVIVKWYKGERELRETLKYSIKRDETRHSLIVNELLLEDINEYSAVVLDEKTSAKLNIDG